MIYAFQDYKVRNNDQGFKSSCTQGQTYMIQLQKPKHRHAKNEDFKVHCPASTLPSCFEIDPKFVIAYLRVKNAGFTRMSP